MKISIQNLIFIEYSVNLAIWKNLNKCVVIVQYLFNMCKPYHQFLEFAIFGEFSETPLEKEKPHIVIYYWSRYIQITKDAFDDEISKLSHHLDDIFSQLNNESLQGR